jgi:hypothetical protein
MTRVRLPPLAFTASSSKGKTAVFGTANWGSNPWGATLQTITKGYVMEKNIILTAQYDAANTKTTVEIPWDSNITTLLQSFYVLAMSMGYHHDSWEDAILSAAEEIKDKELDKNNKPPTYNLNDW